MKATSKNTLQKNKILLKFPAVEITAKERKELRAFLKRYTSEEHNTYFICILSHRWEMFRVNRIVKTIINYHCPVTYNNLFTVIRLMNPKVELNTFMLVEAKCKELREIFLAALIEGRKAKWVSL